MSLKHAGDLCVMTMKNDAKFEELKRYCFIVLSVQN